MIDSAVSLTSSHFSRLTPCLGIFHQSLYFLMLYFLSFKKLCNSGTYFTGLSNSHHFSLVREREIQHLRQNSVVVFSILSDKNIRIKILQPPSVIVALPVKNIQMDAPHYSNSSAQKIIQGTINKDRPLLKGKDDGMYYKNPFTNYVIQLADGFDSFLGCGLTRHTFRLCPHSAENR